MNEINCTAILLGIIVGILIAFITDGDKFSTKGILVRVFVIALALLLCYLLAR